MKLQGWVVAALIAGGVVYQSRGCLNQLSPDQRLAGHFEELCSIARAHIDSPVRGVDELGAFAVKHGDTMLSELGATIILIERVKDDQEHDDRARLARDRIAAPTRACERDWQRFAQAVQGNREAKQKVDRAMVRLNRTFEILFGGKAVDFATLPQVLEHALDAQLRVDE